MKCTGKFKWNRNCRVEVKSDIGSEYGLHEFQDMYGTLGMTGGLSRSANAIAGKYASQDTGRGEGGGGLWDNFLTGETSFLGSSVLDR